MIHKSTAIVAVFCAAILLCSVAFADYEAAKGMYSGLNDIMGKNGSHFGIPKDVQDNLIKFGLPALGVIAAIYVLSIIFRPRVKPVKKYVPPAPSSVSQPSVSAPIHTQKTNSQTTEIAPDQFSEEDKLINDFLKDFESKEKQDG